MMDTSRELTGLPLPSILKSYNIRIYAATSVNVQQAILVLAYPSIMTIKPGPYGGFYVTIVTELESAAIAIQKYFDELQTIWISPPATTSQPNPSE